MSDRPSPPGLAVLLACVPGVVSGIVLLGSLYFGLAQCDESCTGDGWRHTEGAWQWNLMPLLGIVALAAGAALLVFVWRRRPAGALVSLLVGTMASLAVATGLSPLSREDLSRHPKTAGVCALIFFAGLFAAFLSAPGSPDQEVRARTD